MQAVAMLYPFYVNHLLPCHVIGDSSTDNHLAHGCRWAVRCSGPTRLRGEVEMEGKKELAALGGLVGSLLGISWIGNGVSNAGPNWTLHVNVGGGNRDTIVCLWTDNRAKMIEQAKLGDTSSFAMTGWNGNVPKITVKMSFGDKPVAHAIVGHASDTIQLGHAQHVWTGCGDIDSPLAHISVELWRNGRFDQISANQPDAFDNASSFQLNAVVSDQ
jgi:hypothetical protein